MGIGRWKIPIIAIVVFGVIVCAWLWLRSPRMQADADQLVIDMMKVGSADAAVLQIDGQTIVIDCGEQDDGKKVVDRLRDIGTDAVDLLIITHFDQDHVGGADTVLENVPVRQVIVPDYAADGKQYRQFRDVLDPLVRDGSTQYRSIAQQTQLQVGNAAITLYPAEDPAAWANDDEVDNNNSLITRLQYDECVFLFAADVEWKRMRQLVSSDVDWSADWMKMPHHGEYSSDLELWLARIQPSHAVICCSEKHPPADHTIKLLEQQEIATYLTDESDVITVSDGNTIAVRK